MSNLATVALAVLVLNFPFGFWRAGVRRFTLPWFLAVHAPVPVVVGLRVLSGLGWQLSTVPVLAGAFLAGQFLGGRLRYWWEKRCGAGQLGS
jgi:F0F1-type ATP synthase membrane subunit a